MSLPILAIENLHIHFDTYAGTVYAVNGITFDVYPGEMLGLVGESGCGKSVTGLAAMGIVERPGRIIKGQIMFNGEDIRQKSAEEMQKIRGGRIAMIFQNPGASLNPVFTIGNQQLGVASQSHCNHGPLLHAPAKVMGVGFEDALRVG